MAMISGYLVMHETAAIEQWEDNYCWTKNLIALDNKYFTHRIKGSTTREVVYMVLRRGKKMFVELCPLKMFELCPLTNHRLLNIITWVFHHCHILNLTHLWLLVVCEHRVIPYVCESHHFFSLKGLSVFLILSWCWMINLNSGFSSELALTLLILTFCFDIELNILYEVPQISFIWSIKID